MSVFHPDLYLERVTQLTGDLLAVWGIKGLILDVDNTLTTHGNPDPAPDVLLWLDRMRAAGLRLIILSNNHPPRVEPFAKRLGLGFTADAKKPLRGGFRRAAGEMGLPAGEVAVVGDQIFTDILGGNLFGARTVLVKPMEPETAWFFRFKRRLERDILKAYHRKKGEPR